MGKRERRKKGGGRGKREKCQYKNSSEHVVSALGKEFVCDRDAVLDGYCEFHHPSCWKENGEELRRKFYEIVEDAIENSKPLIAIGYHLPEIDLRGKISKIPVLFIDAKFYGKIDFGDVEFHNSIANFSNSEFYKGSADFRGAKFHESNADFTEAEFHESIVDFKGAEFHKSITCFSNSKFHKSIAYFWSAKFHESRTDFKGAEFHKESDAFFVDVKFHKSIVDFTDSKFHESRTNFGSAEFHEESIVFFVNAEFHESEAYFTEVEFHKESRAYFGGAEFHESIVDFTDSKFHESEAHFSNSEFYKSTADFRSTKFHKSTAYFTDAKFHKESIANFSNSEFQGVAIFEKVKFNEVMFINSIFVIPINECASDELYKMIIKKEDVDKNEILDSVSFRGAIFPEAPHKAIFDHTYLGRASFLGANIERIDFRNVVWPEVFRKFLWLEVGKRCMIFDEALLRLKADDKLRKKLLSKLDDDKRKYYEWIINSPDITIVNVVGVYNMLRENYEYFLKYDEAGKFFISEMEVKRLIREDKTKSSKNGAEVRTGYKLNSWFRRNLFLIGLYKHIALYGETVLRQILISILLVAFFWGLRIIKGICSVEPCNYFEQLVDSVAAYMQVPRALTVIDTAERIISIPILSTVFIALRRKLERRYRH